MSCGNWGDGGLWGDGSLYCSSEGLADKYLADVSAQMQVPFDYSTSWYLNSPNGHIWRYSLTFPMVVWTDMGAGPASSVVPVVPGPGQTFWQLSIDNNGVVSAVDGVSYTGQPWAALLDTGGNFYFLIKTSAGFAITDTNDPLARDRTHRFSVRIKYTPAAGESTTFRMYRILPVFEVTNQIPGNWFAVFDNEAQKFSPRFKFGGNKFQLSAMHAVTSLKRTRSQLLNE